MLKKFSTLVFIILLCACAQPSVNLTDSQTGAPLPNPLYHGRTIGDKLSFTYYYVAEYAVKDVDQSIQTFPVYLDKRTDSISRKKIHSLSLVLQVFNPTEKKYAIYSARNYQYNNGKPRFHDYRQEAASHLPYREYRFPMPLDEKVKKAYLEVTVTDKKNGMLFRIGKFEYSLN
jgi:hypothetical protein